MASGLILNPHLLFQTLPLATSTATLAHALLELTTNTAFLIPSLQPTSDKVLPKWFSHVFNRAVWTVLGLNLGTITSAAGTLLLNRYYPQKPLQTTAFYWVGLAGAVGHLVFVPFVAGPVKRIVDDSGVGASVDMRRWVGVHRVRMVVADFSAWVAFVGAVLTL
ncbi:Pc22g08220 [Penicillium rubens Wisconsin 54-1255]|uniref:Pc22g08220 protein n=1 Tax=Penicillium rubens (strain ATCC 28089 / DSM 1075 / NRRL 1951 / Wisconsin 54-1255) TaxID=500485 RepID=B6HS88_PENRW|nr:Pc22g08220 [Penicillium rubens Wisconsin 54-1255]